MINKNAYAWNVCKKITSHLFVCGVFISFPVGVHAQLSAPIATTWVTNGTVNAIVADPINPNLVYLGGSFQSVGPSTGVGARVTTSTGQLITSPALESVKVNGTIRASTSDGTGGFYIAGTFTMVGTTVRDNIARILPNGALDTVFNPGTPGSATITTLVLSSDGATLYVGGNAFLSAVDTATGLTTAFNPGVNGLVTALALSSDGTTLYAGGGFSTLGGQTRLRIGAVNTTTGLATSFNPNANAEVFAIALSPDGATLYAGGSFNTLGGQIRNHIGAVNTITGLATSFDPGADADVRSLALSSDGTILYTGGDFSSLGVASRNQIGAINTTTGLATSFNPDADTDVRSLTLSSDGTTLYAGGGFSALGGQIRNHIGAVNTITGLATSFDPGANSDVLALALSPDGATLYAGGAFGSIGLVARGNLASFDMSTGAVSAFNPETDDAITSLAISSNGATLYVGGNFSNLGGQFRPKFGAVNTTTGLATSFNPSTSGGAVLALTLSSNGAIIYAGGNFSTLGGQSRNRIGAVNTTTGLATSFTPGANSDVLALALSSDRTKLYAGGSFDSVGGGLRRGFAAFGPVPGVTVSPSFGLTTTENGGTATSNIVLSTLPTADVTIGLTSSNTAEGTVSPSSLTFTTLNWNVPQVVTATGVDDVSVDGDITYTVITGLATSADVNYNAVNPVDISLTNTDTDVIGFTIVPTTLTTTEAGGTATSNIVLSTLPTADVTIGLTSSNTAEGTVSPSSLTFTTLNWNVPQVITVTGVDDVGVDGDIVYSIITAFTTSADLTYNNLNPIDITVTNTDNDSTPVIVSSGGGSSGGAIPFAWRNPPVMPNGGFAITINQNDVRVTSSNVTLTLRGGPDTTRVELSNFADFRNVVQESYEPVKTWDLCKSVTICLQGTYTVYAKYYSSLGNVSSGIVSDTILYENTNSSLLPNNKKIIPLFQRSLKLGNVSESVRYLQIFLNTNPDTQVAEIGAGSLGKETQLFGRKTARAVSAFQEKYADEILKPLGLMRGTGFMGGATRAKINEIIGTLQ